MSRLPLRVAARRLLALAALFQGAALSPALAQLDSTPNPVLLDLRYAAPLDLDGDGRDEIVGVPYSSNALNAYTFDGDGKATFDRRLADLGWAQPQGNGRWSLQLADMDGDGRDDIIQVDGTRLFIFYDRGGPQFEERVGITFAPSYEFVTLDFDGDGDLDLFAFSTAAGSGGSINWIENLGGGAFSDYQNLGTGATSGHGLLRPADIDGDGDLDLVGTHRGEEIPTVIRNLGGSFQNEPIANGMQWTAAIALEDLDGDGLLDLVARRDFIGGSAFDLYRGAPGGFLTPTVVLDSPERILGEQIFANVDGVGRNELICQVGVSAPEDRAFVIFEWSPQTNSFGVIERVEIPFPSDLLSVGPTADFDGDGKEDLMVLVSDQAHQATGGRPYGPQILLGAVDAGALAMKGPFRLMESSPVGRPSAPLFTGDVDGDGVADLVESRRADLLWQRGLAGSVNFDCPVRISDAANIELVEDFDGDGLAEILLTENNFGAPASVSVIKSLGAGDFSAPVTIVAALPGSGNISFRAYDFDRDGDLDLLPAPDSPRLFWIENLGSLNFAPPRAIPISISTTQARLHAGDFNGDGNVDLLEETGDSSFVTYLGWFAGLGGGSFGPRQALVQFPAVRPAVLDINEDGLDDVTYSVGQDTFTLVGNPAGLGAASAPVRIFGRPFRGPSVELIDMNDDGLTDFVELPDGFLTGPQPAFVRIGPLAFDSAPITIAPTRVQLVDFGGDGDLDGLGALSDFDWAGQIDVIYEGLSRGVSGTSYCGPAVPNSSGSPASLLALGTNEVQQAELKLRASDAGTNTFGFFLVSPVSQPATSVVGSAGRLCLGGAIGRYVAPGQVQSTGLTGSFELNLDLTAIPTPLGPMAALPGATWYFQAWFRDFGPSGPTSNFTDGVELNFQ